MTLRLTPDQWAEVAASLGVIEKHTPASATPNAPTLHGPFPGNANQLGIFSTPGVRPSRFMTLARPDSRFVSMLAVNRSIWTKERLELMTGVTASAGTNATGFCGTPPQVGQGKVCEQDYIWGNYYVRTKLDVIPLAGEYYDRADVPAEILNTPRGIHPFIPSPMYVFEDRRARYLMWMIGVAAERSWDIVLFQGNSSLAYTATNHGWIAEPEGLDRMIKTGHTDSKTGLACPAADSAVVSFSADIGSTIAAPDSRNFVQALSDLYWGLRDRAMKYGMDQTQWAIVMRPEMFRPAVENWACNYNTYRCSSSTGGQPYVNMVTDTNALRLEMQNGNYLLIDGERVPVFFSEGITRDVVGNQHFKSDLYVVPVSWGGVPLTRIEYFPMDNPEAMELNQESVIQRKVINNGMWLMSSADTPNCVEFHFSARMRLILETPFLAGRLDDISYTFRAPIRNAQTGDTFFYADGGQTYRSPLD